MTRPSFTAGSILLSLTALLALAACGDASTSPRLLAPVGDASPPVLSIGSIRRAVPQTPCTAAAAYHQFDFWLGEWYVTSDGDFDGTNNVTSELDGCLVAEHWNDVGEIRGWSLNAYDRSTGLWYQHWVDETGLNLLLSGSLQNGDMVLSGPRKNAAGLTVIDRIRYTPLPGGQMRQFWDRSTNGGATFPIVAFDGLYDPQPGVVPPATPGTTFCSAAGYHAADFLAGDWRVEAANGLELGRSRITSELSGCLLLEQLTTPKGYRARSFVSFARAAATWSRTYVDSEGEHTLLQGAVSDDRLVLTGSVSAENGDRVIARLTWTKTASGSLEQVWEVSRDGGATWTFDQKLVYVPA